MDIFRYSKLYIAISIFFVGTAILSILFLGLNFGIDFTGGSVMEVRFEGELPSVSEVRSLASGLDLGSFSVQPVGEQGMLLRMKDISVQTHSILLERLGENASELRFESIGSAVGAELRAQTVWMIALGILMILFYIMIAFRRITAPFHSWQYSVAAIVALVHDLVIPMGVLAILGWALGAQFTIPIVVALLAVLGYSINDTVVVFDRIRENVLAQTTFDIQDTLNKSFLQTLSRNIGTSFTTLLAIGAIFLFGGETLHYFALTLMVGIVAGTYSSLFLAPSLLLWVVRYRQRGVDRIA